MRRLPVKSNRSNQIFHDDLMNLPRGTGLLLRGEGRGYIAVEFDCVEVYHEHCLTTLAYVQLEGRPRNFCCVGFGAIQDKEGYWEQDFWVELDRNHHNFIIRWQEVGF